LARVEALYCYCVDRSLTLFQSDVVQVVQLDGDFGWSRVCLSQNESDKEDKKQALREIHEEKLKVSFCLDIFLKLKICIIFIPKPIHSYPFILSSINYI
jgi:hypothetical protein